MKLIGLIGGMSWESSAEYYRILNQRVRERLGGQHSARLLMVSVDFAVIERMQREDRWDDAAAVLIDAAGRLQRGGADIVLLCTNTMHKLAPALETALQVPLLHIADAAGRGVQRAGLQRVGLLGTRFTMEQAFYRERLQSRFELQVDVPAADERDAIHRIIYDELCRGVVSPASRDAVLAIVQRMAATGVEGFVLGCTELPLLLQPGHCALPLFDTTRLHAEWALQVALDDAGG